MGQKNSRRLVYNTPEVERPTQLRKAGSLSTLVTHGPYTSKKEKTFSLRRTRSFSERQEEEDIYEQLRERVEKEARYLNEWVSELRESPSKLQMLASLAVASYLKTPLDIERLPCQRSVKEQVEFMLVPVFDERIGDPSVAFSNSGHTIYYNGKSYSTSVIKTPLDQGIYNGRHAWILYIENSRVQGWIQIGIINKYRWDMKCKTSWDGNPHPFRKGELARRSNGNFHSGRDTTEATIAYDSIFLGGYGKGDTIGVKLDCERNEISWTKNGEPYGDSVSIPEKPVWPSISLDSPGEAVSLVYYTCTTRSHKHRTQYNNTISHDISHDYTRPLYSGMKNKYPTLDRF